MKFVTQYNQDKIISTSCRRGNGFWSSAIKEILSWWKLGNFKDSKLSHRVVHFIKCWEALCFAEIKVPLKCSGKTNHLVLLKIGMHKAVFLSLKNVCSFNPQIWFFVVNYKSIIMNNRLNRWGAHDSHGENPISKPGTLSPTLVMVSSGVWEPRGTQRGSWIPLLWYK